MEDSQIFDNPWTKITKKKAPVDNAPLSQDDFDKMLLEDRALQGLDPAAEAAAAAPSIWAALKRKK